jgi:hypothetical protein
MPEPPPDKDHDVPARASARRDLSSPEGDERAVVVPARTRPPRDYVDDVGEASFPASDPPSWWGGH